MDKATLKEISVTSHAAIPTWVVPVNVWLLPMACLWQPATSLEKKQKERTLTKALQCMLGFHGKMKAKEHKKKKKWDVDQ